MTAIGAQRPGKPDQQRRAGTTGGVAALAALLVVAALPDAASPQDTEYHFGETMEVRIINVDVVVRDEDGNLVQGLTAADFVIHENGRPQPITNFAEYRAEPPVMEDSEADAAPLVIRPPEKRVLLFFIDSLNLREPVNRAAFFGGLRAFVESSMRDGDEAAVFYWETSLRTMVGMTTDRSAIVEAITEIEGDSRLRIDPADMELAELEIRERMREGDPPSLRAQETEEERWEAGLAARRAFDLQQRKINAINYAIQSAAGLDGRKVMILATDRLSKLPGLEYGYGYALADRELNARKQIDSVVRNANAAGVTVYGFFPKGIEKDLPTSAVDGSRDIQVSETPMGQAAQSWYELMNQAEPIDSISTRTGGMSALGGKLSQLALAESTRQLDNYYSLAYRAPDDRTDRTRRIEVKVARPGVTVLARSAVVDRSDAEVERDRVVSAILYGNVRSAIDIGARVAHMRKSGLTKVTVGVEIAIPIAQLTTLPGSKGHDGTFRVLAVAANARGDVSEVVAKDQAFHIPTRDLERARAATFTYEIEIEVRAESNRVLVAVVDAIDGDTGYALVALDPE
jgi:VWFA-related protein